jgi:hypothetical protein
MSQGIGGPGPAHEDEDDLDRQLRELTGGLMAEPALKEPSAAERAKRARRDRKKDRRNQRRQRRNGRGFQLKAWAIAAVVLAAAGGVTWLGLSHSSAGRSTGQQQPLSGAQAGAPPADPFAGTKGENWANGESGIVIPATTMTVDVMAEPKMIWKSRGNFRRSPAAGGRAGPDRQDEWLVASFRHDENGLLLMRCFAVA